MKSDTNLRSVKTPVRRPWPLIIFGGICCATMATILTTPFELLSGETSAAVKGTTSLVIVASQSHPRSNGNEFIVIRTGDDFVTWSATTNPKGDNPDVSGRVNSYSLDLKKLFTEIESAKPDGSNATTPAPAPACFYSLLMIDDGANAQVALSPVQCELLRSRLGPVLRDIQRNGPYAKANLMLNLLLDANSPRDIAVPSTTR